MVSVLLSRFIMNLRDISLSTSNSKISTSTLRQPRFSIVEGEPSFLVGNLGAPLDLRRVDRDDESVQDLEFDGERREFEGVSDDPLTTGMVLDEARSRSARTK